MVRFWKQLLSEEKGQMLPIVLGVLVLGGLTIAASLSYCTTALKGSQIVREEMNGIYAAGAGVEYALWALGNGQWSIPDGQEQTRTLSDTLSDNVNGMAVSTTTTNLGTYCLVFGSWYEPRAQWWKVKVTKSIEPWGEPLGGYRYSVNVTFAQQDQVQESINLEEIGARLPVGYSYAGSATVFEEDSGQTTSLADPASPIPTDSQGAQLVKWGFSEPKPKITKDKQKIGEDWVWYTRMVRLSFRITGTGSRGGAYAWTEGQPNIIGMVGEFTGTVYKITATANVTRNVTRSKIVADIQVQSGAVNLMSWRIVD